jgi:hypothetical protein
MINLVETFFLKWINGKWIGNIEQIDEGGYAYVLWMSKIMIPMHQ